MSLINQMLRDLDERRASSLERGGLAAQVRALPPEKRFPWASVLPIVIGAAIGGAGIWFALDASQSSAPVSGAAAAPLPIVRAPPAPMALPALLVPMPTEPPEAVAKARAMEQLAAPVPESLQLDTRLSTVPARATAAAAAAPSAPAPAAQIDKRPLAQAADSADGEYRKAVAAYRQGRTSEAVDGFQSALRIDPRNVAARQSLLSLLLDQQRWPEAQKAAAEGLALLPAQAGWAMILARLQVEQGQVAEAERTLAAHAQHGERSADYLAFHGLLLEKLQRAQEARAAFVKARDLGNLPPELAAAIEQRLR